MECKACTGYRKRVAIRGTAQLLRLVHQAQEAVAARVLRCVPASVDRRVVPAPPFASLPGGASLPDLVHYQFSCTACGRLFVLLCDTRHGAGGQWWPSGMLPAARAWRVAVASALVGVRPDPGSGARRPRVPRSWRWSSGR